MKRGNTVSVRRADGAFLASFGYTNTDASAGALREALERSQSGHVLSYGLRGDGGRRLLTYQTLSELPLIITVGELESQILSGYQSHRSLYLTIAAVLTLMVLTFTVFGLERQLDSQIAHDNLRAAFESIPHGLTMFDANGALIVSNTRYGELYHLPDKLRQRGTSFEAIYEHCAKEGTVKGDLSRPDVWKQLARAKSGEHFSNRLELADGHIVSLTQSPMHNGGWVTLHEDITDKLNAENQKEDLQQRLAQSQKLEVVGQLTGGIAHDFNNLLLVIIGNLDLLKDTASPSSQELDLIETSLAAALSGSELSNSLLAFSRRQTFKIEPINVKKTVSEQIRLLRRAVGSKIVIEEKYSDEDLVTTVDNAQFRSALTNLVVNARDAMPDGGMIAVSAHRYTVPESGSTEHAELAAGDYAVLEVKDTGTGMPPEVVSKIFEPFFTTKEVGKGTGLGLSMVYGFIKEMKGIIRVASKIGEGTTFSIYLPCAKPLPVVIGPSLAPSSALATQTREQTILVVDDDDGVRKLVVNQINSLGYRVIDAATPDKALAVIESDEQLDLLFSDVVMPGPMDGLQLAQVAHERRPDLKILLTTGYPDLKFARSSSDEYQQWSILKKPYRRDELKAKLKKMLEHSEQGASGEPGHRGETATTGLLLHG
jgi:signal transduction histidine kinase/FixJ family two-component response regulator